MADLKDNKRALSAGWTFLTNHAHVLLCLAENPDMRMRAVADRVGITERAVQRIVAELEEAGHLQRAREGRTNRYTVREGRFLRHPIESHCTVDELIAMVIRGRPRSLRRQKRVRHRNTFSRRSSH